MSRIRGPSPARRPTTRSPSCARAVLRLGARCARRRRRARAAHRSTRSATRLTPSGVYEPQSMLTSASSSARNAGQARVDDAPQRGQVRAWRTNILTPMPRDGRPPRRPTSSCVELRVLDGPNRFFSRPAVKLEFRGDEPGAAMPRRPPRRRAGRAAPPPRARAAGAAHRDPPLGRSAAHAPSPSRGAAGRSRRPSARRRPAWRSGARPIGASSPACGRRPSGRCRTCRRPRIPIVAITGTNGKSTTTRLIAHICAAAGTHGRDDELGRHLRARRARRGGGLDRLRRRVADPRRAGPRHGRARDGARRHPAARHRLHRQRRQRRDQRQRRSPRAAGDRHARRAGRGEGHRRPHHEARRLGRPQRR